MECVRLACLIFSAGLWENGVKLDKDNLWVRDVSNTNERGQIRKGN
jgi:hypothetical protein